MPSNQKKKKNNNNNNVIIAGFSNNSNNRNVGANSGANIVAFLFQLQVSTKMFHWQTRSYAAHVASGDLYDEIVRLTDEIIEEYMGTYGRPRMPSSSGILVPNMTTSSMKTLLKQGMQYLSTRMPSDTHILNLRDELLGVMAKVLYLLTLG